jgi:hypothetical protein
MDPGARYQLRFAVRAEKLISGGLPVVMVIDANGARTIGQSEPFPNQTDGWREFTLDFETDKSVNAVRIALQRQPCNTMPCPIFGRLWLDGFSLRRW